MILRDFKIDDIINNSQYKTLDEKYQKVLVESLRPHTENAYTLEHNGEIIGSAGFISPWKGMASGWGFFSNLIYRHPLAFHRTMKTMIAVLEAKHNLVRIQADCLSGFDRYSKWLKSLGFEQEGVMRKAGPNGETMLRFARVK